MEDNIYIQTRTPDKVELAHLVNQAKGEDRTMAQFAKDCQISAPTLSRIVNGKMAKPLTDDTIKKIFDSRAELSDSYLLDRLRRANGMLTEEELRRTRSKISIYAKQAQLLEQKTRMKNIIVTELFDRGVSVVNATCHSFRMDDGTTACEVFPGRIGDMAVTLNIEQPDSDVWAFYWFPQEPEEPEKNPRRLVHTIIRNMSSLFLVDAWQPEIIKGLKTSFVFSHPQVFERFLSTLKDAKLNTEMSAILLDMQAGCVKEERWLPGQAPSTEGSLFSRPKVDLDGEDSGDEEDYGLFNLINDPL